MASFRLKKFIQKPLAFVLSLTMVLSAFLGMGIGLTGAAAAPGDIPEGSVYVVFGDPDEAEGLTYDATAEIPGAALDFVVDRYAWVLPNGPAGNHCGYIYLKASGAFLATLDAASGGGFGPLTVSIDYFDDPTQAGGQFYIYNGNTVWSWTEPITMKGSGTWKTANIVINNFVPAAINNGYDFRLDALIGKLNDETNIHEAANIIREVIDTERARA